MDVGKQCLIIAILGAVLAIVSSPFIIYMGFTGKPFTTLVEKPVLEPFPPNIFGPILKIMDNGTRFPCNVMNFTLTKVEEQQYKVILNVETNGTINVAISKKDSTYTISDTFNSGNTTRDLTSSIQTTGKGLYILNVVDTNNRTINAKFKITESWYSARIVLEPQLDLLKTAGSPIGLVMGLVILVYALVKLRRAAREARPATTGRTARKQPRYVEVEEEEDE